MTDYALITGSTSGIGSAFAEKCATAGHNLVLVSRDEQSLSIQKKHLENTYGVTAEYLALDLSEGDAARKVHSFTDSRDIRIGILVNNAGFNECGAFLSTDLDKERSMIRLHALFVTEMMKYFIPSMVRHGHGRVINVGSTGSFIACPDDAVYAATKAYVLHLSRAVQAELRNTGVSVTTLCPGSTRTAFAAKAGMEETLLFKLFVMSPETVASIGYDAMMRGRTTVIAGLYNKAMVMLSKVTPAPILDALTRKMLAGH